MTFSPGDRQVKAWPFADANFEIDTEPVEELVSGAFVTEATDQDQAFEVFTGAVVDIHQHIGTSTPCEIISLHPEIAIVDLNGVARRVSDGSATILARSPRATKRTAAAVVRNSGGSFSNFVGFVDGSLARTCADGVDLRLPGQLNLFSTMQHGTATYVRNPNCWAAGIDLSGISPWNSIRGQSKAGTLITRKHVAHAQHYGLHPGYVLRFVSMANEVFEREVVAAAQVGTTDIRIATLDAELPEAITHYQILPSSWADHLPSLNRRVPIFTKNRFNRAWVLESQWFKNGVAFFHYPTTQPRQAHAEVFDSGDSGNPGAFVVNNTLVLVTCWAGGGAGELYCDHLAAINAICAPYQVEVADFSAFPTYV